MLCVVVVVGGNIVINHCRVGRHVVMNVLCAVVVLGKHAVVSLCVKL